MSRFTQNFTSQFTSQQVFDFFADYLMKEGFSQHTEKGEGCWKKGVGMATYPQFIKLTRTQTGIYTLEAWLKYPILPGVYVGELGLSGFFAVVPKQLLQKRVDDILNALKANKI